MSNFFIFFSAPQPGPIGMLQGSSHNGKIYVIQLEGIHYI